MRLTYSIRPAAESDIDTLVGFTLREAAEAEVPHSPRFLEVPYSVMRLPSAGSRSGDDHEPPA